jgi:hypothetical protein
MYVCINCTLIKCGGIVGGGGEKDNISQFYSQFIYVYFI